MRKIYVILLIVLAVVLLVWVQKWCGPVVPALTVELKPLELRIVASGEVRYPSLARLGSEITGTVIKRHVREGDTVKKGDLLVELDPKEAQSRLAQAHTLLQQLQTLSHPQAQAALIEARENLNQARREAQRRQALVNKGTIATELAEQARRTELNAKAALTQAQLTADAMAPHGSEERLLRQRVNSAEADLAKTKIYAPFSGRIQTRNVELGDLVQPSTILFEIARHEPAAEPSFVNQGLEVVVALDEKNFAPLQLQQPVQLIADAWPAHSITGIVSFIAPAVDSARGTIDVHIDVQDQDLAQPTLLPGMTVAANIMAAQRHATLVLPNDYLVFDAKDNHGTEAEAFRWENGKVNRTRVQLGLRNMTHSEVVFGLNQGDVVVQADNINEGQRARVRFEQAPHVIR